MTPPTGSTADYVSTAFRAQQMRAQLAHIVQSGNFSAASSAYTATLPAFVNGSRERDNSVANAVLAAAHHSASGMFTSFSDISEAEKEQGGPPLPPEPFKTLLSAGVRMQGRSREELLQKAKHIRQRRRESAARCRARRAKHFVELEHENKALREENWRLKALLESLERK
eukprot:CAMPEP_0177756684 /NCGR_PEP_ID=MMETSP0491_2-20121128/3241_1 /TAXON_ID=63592 /ORGANISM="Tetraselmis chuii, Strain PLY429" /LENGTH=169 /DNA_ID=CAMNT_0019272285 /DNA_START=657 /DNA_END=1166 /DNA_ORIENTATION=+